MSTSTAAERSPQVLADFTLPSEPGNERFAIRELAGALSGVDLAPARLERLKTAVAEATMNAIEHGNANQAELPVRIQVLLTGEALTVRITDQGGGQQIPDAELPDIEAKLAGLQTPRGWGLFLIENMVDRLTTEQDDHHHTVELLLHLKGEPDASDAV